MKIRYLEIINFRGIKSLSAKIEGDFMCLIGHGDSCKSTILTAIDYALSPRWNLNIDDSDFFNQEITDPISISVTLCEWDMNHDQIKKFFEESRYGQYIGGLGHDGPISEPIEDTIPSITINLCIDKSLEPKWSVVKGDESKIISSSDRNIFGVGRIDANLDSNFTWGRNSILSRLSCENDGNLNFLLGEVARTARDSYAPPQTLIDIANSVNCEAEKFGVIIDELSPKLDIQKLLLSSGALALHHKNIPIRNLGMGSKKLISCAMQMKLYKGRNIALIDEIELGLEPHRIRGLIINLKQSGQQVITTTHSSVVLRELKVDKHELYVCKEHNGNIDIKSLSGVPDLQKRVRSNAEAFLGRKIIVCEGATEIGCLRALDDHMFTKGSSPVWSIHTAYYDANGIGKVKETALKLKDLGYDVAVFCDNDAPEHFSSTDITELETQQIKVFCWDNGNSIEQQLFIDLAWKDMSKLLDIIAEEPDSKDKEALIQSVKTIKNDVSDECTEWLDTTELRTALGEAAKGKMPSGKTENKAAWFKRIGLAEAVFNYIIPKLAHDKIMFKKLDALWQWVQGE